jgi:uncharacterized protein
MDQEPHATKNSTYTSASVPRIVIHDSALAFLARIEPTLAPCEREHHLVLGVANSMPAATFITVERDNVVRLAAIAAPKRPLILTVSQAMTTEDLDALVEWLPAQGHTPKSFIADLPHAERFAQAWGRRHGEEPRLRMRQRLHCLTAVSSIKRAPGQLIQADADDLDLLLQWQSAFNGEALGDAPDPEMRDALAQRIDEGEMFLWVDGEPRSMAALARPTRHGVAINSVYTPSEWRGRGYATACVSALSQRVLECGKEFCVLYTDLANPTSNAIYLRIGYHPLADSLVYEIEGRSGSS